MCSVCLLTGFTLPSVLPQEADIDSIHQLVVGATENIKEGNEDIREVCAHPPGPSPGPALVFTLSSHWGRTGATWAWGVLRRV